MDRTARRIKARVGTRDRPSIVEGCEIDVRRVRTAWVGPADSAREIRAKGASSYLESDSDRFALQSAHPRAQRSERFSGSLCGPALAAACPRQSPIDHDQRFRSIHWKVGQAPPDVFLEAILTQWRRRSGAQAVNEDTQRPGVGQFRRLAVRQQLRRRERGGARGVHAESRDVCARGRTQRLTRTEVRAIRCDEDEFR